MIVIASECEAIQSGRALDSWMLRHSAPRHDECLMNAFLTTA
jgi:hypothetical protein